MMVCHRQAESILDRIDRLVEPYFDKVDSYEYLGPVIVLAPFFAPGFLCIVLAAMADGFSLFGSIVLAFVCSSILMAVFTVPKK